MKRKLGAIVLVVALALSLGLVPAAPAMATTVTETYESEVGDQVRMLEISDPASGPANFTALESAAEWTDWHAAVATDHGSWADIPGVGWITSDTSLQYPGGDWWYEFKKGIAIPPLAGNISGSIQVNADNANEVHVNGDTYCAGNPPNDTQDGEVYGTWSDDHEWGYINTWDVSTSLQPGTTNELLIVVRNYPVGSVNPHGVTYKLTVSYELPDIEKSFVDSEGDPVEDGYLGDIITVTLEVENPYTSATVEDVIPDGLKYIPFTFEVDGSPVTPTVADNTISTTVDQGDFTITFDVQVVEVQCEEVDVENWAYLLDGTVLLDSDSEDITLWPYEGFVKTFTIVHEDNPNGAIEVNELVVWDMTITVPNNVGWDITDAVLKDNLGGELGMADDDVNNDWIGGTDDGANGDLGPASNTIPDGNLTIKTKGKTKKVQFKITDIDIGIGGSLDFVLGVFTDRNPSRWGQQSYTSTYEEHPLNSGATLKFTDPVTDFLLSAHTCPVLIDVVDPIPA